MISLLARLTVLIVYGAGALYTAFMLLWLIVALYEPHHASTLAHYGYTVESIRNHFFTGLTTIIIAWAASCFIPKSKSPTVTDRFAQFTRWRSSIGPNSKTIPETF